ncbi:MAG: efflux RND transporter periplasmic adaptor subunit [Cyanobacteria bacterium P01_H01_bin.153]
MQVPGIGKVRRPIPWLVGGLAVLTVGLGAIALFIRSREPDFDLEALTVPVESTTLTVRITASGTVEPLQTVNLSPKASGILEELLVEQGDVVTAGQLIAQMESQDVAAVLRQREAALAEAQANLADVRRGSDAETIAQAEAAVESARAQVRDQAARLDLAQSQLQRNQALAEQGAISTNELDNFVQTVQSAEAALERSQFQVQESEESLADLRNEPRPEAIAQAEARVAQAQAQLESAQVQFTDTQIRAPFAGIVTQKFANEGAFVTPTTSASDATSATSTAIVAIASDLEVLAEVPEADIAKIRPGQAVEIEADAYPDELFTGVVRLIAPEAIERQNVTLFQVRVELTSGQEVLLSNMNVTVAFIGDELTDALVVPTVAVVTQSGQRGVLVPDERNRPQFKVVREGFQVGNQIQIEEGLEVGDQVFIDLPPGNPFENPMFGPNAAPQADE